MYGTDTIVIPNSSFFNTKGDVTFTGYGANKDWIKFRTNSDATKVYEIERANY